MKRRNKYDTKWFVEMATQKHGNKYDYSKTEYIDCATKVCIICPTHGEFWQTPTSHLRKHGCPKCGNIIRTRLQKNTEWFISQANIIHNYKYDYTKTKYTKRDNKVIITCPIHGDFKQLAYVHLKGCGCSLCAYEEKSKAYSDKSKIEGIHKDLNKGEYNKIAYKHWRLMIDRCMSKTKIKKPYLDCKVCNDWMIFSNFNKWFEENYIDGFVLDKDILSKGEKIYSPDTCCFVPSCINTMVARRGKKKNGLPTGVFYTLNNTRFFAAITVNGKTERIGTFDTIEEASRAYNNKRKEIIIQVADKYKNMLDCKVYDAIIGK